MNHLELMALMKKHSQPELVALMKKQKELHGYSHYNKEEKIKLLVEKGFLKVELIEPPPPQQEKKIDPKHIYLRKIRKEKKMVTVTDVETGEEKIYPSIYSCSRALEVNSGIIGYYDGKIYKGKYKINITRDPVSDDENKSINSYLKKI